MVRVVLIRHGRTKGNMRDVFVGGRTDEPLFDDTSNYQLNLAYPAVDLVFSSPMKRCVQTASIIYPKQKPIIYDDLKEYDFGDFEGLSKDELIADNPDYEYWLDSGEKLPTPGGENPILFQNRCVDAFKKIITFTKNLNMKKIAIICHNGTIMAILDRISDPHKDYSDWEVSNLDGYIFDYVSIIGKAVEIKCLSDT